MGIALEVLTEIKREGRAVAAGGKEDTRRDETGKASVCAASARRARGLSQSLEDG